ncbi:MAG: ArsR/SmtB family transcription factor [Burkholderiales bacterium]
MTGDLEVAGETRAVKALAALAQTSRLRVFRLLVGTGNNGMYPGQISDALGVPANALSFHLKELHHCDLVTQEREGRFLRYRANLASMQELMEFMTAHCCQGVPCGVIPVIDCRIENKSADLREQGDWQSQLHSST